MTEPRRACTLVLCLHAACSTTRFFACSHECVRSLSQGQQRLERTAHSYFQLVPAGSTWQEKLVFTGCLTSQQHASVPLGQICLDNCTCCHTETGCRSNLLSHPVTILTLGPTSPSTDPVMPGYLFVGWLLNVPATG